MEVNGAWAGFAKHFGLALGNGAHELCALGSPRRELQRWVYFWRFATQQAGPVEVPGAGVQSERELGVRTSQACCPNTRASLPQ